ncbi:MAG: heme exporter protein CcmD [Ilumatobacter sp.]|nr:heme exporter protein CcmD [Ilumatobacter sp.]
MEDAGFILGSYLLTFAAVAAFSWRTLRAGRKLADQVPADDRYWR